MIPKTLHLVWLSDRERPLVYDRLLTRFQQINPEWTVKVWNEDACVVNRDVFDAIPPDAPSFRSDVVRYEVLAREGGVYADWDILWRRPLDSLCQLGCFVGYESNKIVCNAVIGCIPWHPFVCALVTRLHESYTTYRSMSNGVGVHYVSRNVTDFRGSVTLLPKSVFHRLHGDGRITPEQTAVANSIEFGTHLYSGAYGSEFVEVVERLTRL